MRLPFIVDDGGRAEFGYKGRTGDCVTRAVAIAARLPYNEIYEIMSDGMRQQRVTKRSKRAASARNGVSTRRTWFRETMGDLGFSWTPTMLIGQGCKVHLAVGELPASERYVLSLSKHYTALIDGSIHDTHDPQWTTIGDRDGIPFRAERCVYGIWTYHQAN